MKILSLLVFLCSCKTSSINTLSTKSDTIKVRINEPFTIKLATSMGTGYSWEGKDSAYTKNMSLDSVTVINNIEGKDDGPDLQVFHFRPLLKSTTNILFIHKRPWQKADKADKEKLYTIIIE